MSMWPLASPATRFVAADWKATKRPLPLMSGLPVAPFGCPDVATSARTSAPVVRSFTKMQPLAMQLLEFGRRFVANDWNATKRPSALMLGVKLLLLAWPPLGLVLTRVM